MDFSFQSMLFDQRKCEWENLRECGSETSVPRSTLSDIIFPFFGIFLKIMLMFLKERLFFDWFEISHYGFTTQKQQ